MYFLNPSHLNVLQCSISIVRDSAVNADAVYSQNAESADNWNRAQGNAMPPLPQPSILSWTKIGGNIEIYLQSHRYLRWSLQILQLMTVYLMTVDFEFHYYFH